MTLLIALAFAASSYVIQTDYCHRWATADIQAVAQCEAFTVVFVRAVEALSLGVMPLPAQTRAAYATAPIARLPRDRLSTCDSSGIGDRTDTESLTVVVGGAFFLKLFPTDPQQLNNYFRLIG